MYSTSDTSPSTASRTSSSPPERVEDSTCASTTVLENCSSTSLYASPSRGLHVSFFTSIRTA